MRNIEFRARWKYSGVIVSNFNEYRIEDCNKQLFIVEEFTGLLDKKGVKVFEGDIVSYVDGYKCSEDDWDEFENRSEIFWDAENARWNITNKNQIGMDDFLDNEDYEVIGNVHDNPELLEVPSF